MSIKYGSIPRPKRSMRVNPLSQRERQAILRLREHGLLQREIAHCFGIDQTTVTRVESTAARNLRWGREAAA